METVSGDVIRERVETNMPRVSLGNLGGRIMGVASFLGGIGLLGWVFYIAYGLFNSPASAALDLHFTGNPKTDPTLALVAARFGWLLFRVCFLLIMASAGSLITQKGINLYLCALQHDPAKK